MRWRAVVELWTLRNPCWCDAKSRCSARIRRRSTSVSLATGDKREIGRCELPWSAGLFGLERGITQSIFIGISISFRRELECYWNKWWRFLSFSVGSKVLRQFFIDFACLVRGCTCPSSWSRATFVECAGCSDQSPQAIAFVTEFGWTNGKVWTDVLGASGRDVDTSGFFDNATKRLLVDISRTSH